MTGSTGRTRYADLMGDAAHQVAVGAASLSRERLSDAATARATVESYWQLLASLHQHAWQLVGGSRRLDGITASARPELPDAAVVRFIDSLAVTTRHPPSWEATPDGPVVRAWASATSSVRTASDLLSTHRGPRGMWVTPEARLLDDPRVRADGLAGLGDLAWTVLTTERDLALRCGQASVPWREVGRRLPDLEPARLAAQDLARGARSGAGGHSVLVELEVARPGIRTGDPFVELGDRVRRLRQTAWQLTHEPHVGMQSLTDYAAAAVIIHTHVGAYLTQGRLDHVTDLPVLSMARRAYQGRSAWSVAHLEGRQLRTATPGLAVVRKDLLSVRDLCQRLLPLDMTTPAQVAPGDRRQVRALANGCIRAFSDIAGWNAAVLENLSRTGQLYVAGHRLTGDQVTDDPPLVEAKIRGSLVPAPVQQVQPLAQAYAAAHSVEPALGWRQPASAALSGEPVPSMSP
jgi:hypothetical protein